LVQALEQVLEPLLLAQRALGLVPQLDQQDWQQRVLPLQVEPRQLRQLLQAVLLLVPRWQVLQVAQLAQLLLILAQLQDCLARVSLALRLSKVQEL
jgi:hypothetical protein